MTTIGVLALQGDFHEHEAVLRRLGVEARQVRAAEDVRGLDGLIIPGGESTTFCRLMGDFRLYEPLGALVRTGFPIWGTCAGMIVLAKQVPDLESPTLEALDIQVRRNAYGRQVDSFEADLDVPALGGDPFHAVFIRAPVVEAVGPGVEVLASLPADAARGGPGRAGSAVAVRQGPFLATAFHPELTDDARFHRYFLEMVNSLRRRSSPK
ncbi:MAG TPA: pyridoxal 5'-phosphate synthase glutaminase subunit PdxT [Dehalococcoidia bacterium]|nr:pyridoxal 5'-phosphate synthase glutaminase subunit PdxT [Dehalococcoidia bacterium]